MPRGLLFYMLNIIEKGKQEAQEKQDNWGFRFLEDVEREIMDKILYEIKLIKFYYN